MNIRIKVGILITADDNKILLIKEKTEENSMPLWNFIKGTVDNLDKGLFYEAQRECLEEVGLKIKLINLIDILFVKNKRGRKIQFNFIARCITNDKPKIANNNIQNKRNENIQDIKWFYKKDLKLMDRKDFISKETYITINKWIKNQKYPIDIINNYNFYK